MEFNLAFKGLMVPKCKKYHFLSPLIVLKRKKLLYMIVETLRYKAECWRFDSRMHYWVFYWHNPSGRTMALGSN